MSPSSGNIFPDRNLSTGLPENPEERPSEVSTTIDSLPLSIPKYAASPVSTPVVCNRRSARIRKPVDRMNL